MSGELGLKSIFKNQVLEPLRQLRGDDGKPGQDVSLLRFCQDYIENPTKPGVTGLTTGVGKTVEMRDIFAEFGIDPDVHTLNFILSLPEDSGARYIAPEVVRDFVDKGLKMAWSSMEDLITGTESSDSLVVIAPWFLFDNAEPQDIGELETIPEIGYTWGKKTVELTKSGVALKLSDELVMSVKINLLSRFLPQVGVDLAAKLFRKAVTTAINGDQSAGADSCAVIGVGSAGTLAFADFVTAWTRGSFIQKRWASMLTNEAMCNTVLAISEFKPGQGLGTPIVNVDSRNRIIPDSMVHRVSSDSAASQVMLFDKSAMMTHMVFRPLLVESERIVSRQFEGQYVSIIDGFITIDRRARIIIDKSIAYSGNGFPSYMAPLV